MFVTFKTTTKTKTKIIKRIAPTLITTTLTPKNKSLKDLCDSSWNAEYKNYLELHDTPDEQKIKKMKMNHYIHVHECHSDQCQIQINRLRTKNNNLEKKIQTLRMTINIAEEHGKISFL